MDERINDQRGWLSGSIAADPMDWLSVADSERRRSLAAMVRSGLIVAVAATMLYCDVQHDSESAGGRGSEGADGWLMDCGRPLPLAG